MRYTIKAVIKEKNETVSNVASKLQLSRPTFDTYIAAYESGLKITKGRYQKIFDSLFSDYYISSDVFKERLELYHELLKSESKNEPIEYLSKRADRTSMLMNEIRDNIRYNGLDNDLYKFINLVITNYSEDIFYNLVQFFLILYGKKDMSHVTDFQTAYFSELYCALSEIDQNEITFNLKDWEKYKKISRDAYLREQLRYMEIEKENIMQKQEEIRRQIYENTITWI